jgi:hypothetical protein
LARGKITRCGLGRGTAAIWVSAAAGTGPAASEAASNAAASAEGIGKRIAIG